MFGFLPVYMTDHFVGRYLRGLFFVVLVTLLVSLLFCLFVTPLFLKAGEHRTDGGRRGLAPYRATLRLLFRAPLVLLVVAVGLGAWGVQSLLDSERVFFPAPSRPLLLVQIEHPDGTPTDTTAASVRATGAFLDEQRTAAPSPIRRWSAFVGRSGPAFQPSLPTRRLSPHYAQLLVELDPAADSAAFQERLATWLAEQDDGALRRVHPVRLGVQPDWPIEVSLDGPVDALTAAADQVAARLRELGCEHVSTLGAGSASKVRVTPDREALAERGLTVADLSLATHAVLQGIPVFEIDEGTSRLPVLIRASRDRDDPLEALRDAYVYPTKGDASLLYEVARVETVRGPAVRSRHRGQASVAVRAEPSRTGDAYRVSQEIAGELPDLAREHADVTFRVGGVYDAERKANDALLEEIPWALLLVLLFLLGQSQSVRETVLILLCIPVSFAGVALGMRVLDRPFSFMTLVGMTALAGLVVNNAIVLLASLRRRIDEHDDGQGSLREALIDSAADRVRPILLTTLCAMASMVVLHRSGGPMWQPLATTIISGLLLSTFLVLFILPALYAGARRAHRR